MKVFASKYLERFSDDTIGNDKQWSWQPADRAIEKIYATGASTSSQMSTYAEEKDTRSDSDRPNEGLLVA